MKITIFWTWYVWLVSWICYAEIWHDVLCVDIDIKKIDKLKSGENIIYEIWLDTLLDKHIKKGKIKFTTNIKEAVIYWDVIFSCVWTPVDIEDWYKADLSKVINVANVFWKYINSYKVFVNKSTVPVWTWKICENIIEKEIKNRWLNVDFDIVSNPEFLREWTAVDDFLNPDRIVYWTSNKRSLKLIREIYFSFFKRGINIIETDIKSSELIKYVSNSFLAMKLSFINEVANFSDKIWTNIDDIAKWLWADNRIWKSYLKSWIWYGWSCFSKDIKAFISFWKEYWFDFKILKDVEKINEKQKVIIINKLLKHIKKISWSVISVWGLSYKEWTDDIRDAPSIDIIKAILKLDAKEVRVFDPVSNINVSKSFKWEKKIIFCNDKYSALEKSNWLLLLTWWNEFNNIDYNIMMKKMHNKLIIDWRNFFNKEEFEKKWFIYEWIWK